MKIFVGYDAREKDAYDTFVYSLRKNSDKELDITALDLTELKQRGLYWRGKDRLGSTEFTFSRFLVPYLSGYQGWSVFFDCDMISTSDVTEIMQYADESKAVMCVKHDYTPKNAMKMDEKMQYVYPRKNWSSVMLFNCAHPANLVMTPTLVSDETRNGLFFHRFSWVSDDFIGELPKEWNWLTSVYERNYVELPNILHYTDGGPWFHDYRDCVMHEEWTKYFLDMNQDV